MTILDPGMIDETTGSNTNRTSALVYPEKCTHGASRPDACGNCWMAALYARINTLETALKKTQACLLGCGSGHLEMSLAMSAALTIVGDAIRPAHPVVAQDPKPLRPRTA